MTANVVEVSYKYVQDLYYRIRHARLGSEAYRLEFLDWIKAGIAFNTLGVKEPSRKISYFVKLYEIVHNGFDETAASEMKVAVTRYYEDFFQLYQDHLIAQLQIAHKRGKNTSTEPDSLILLPSFESVPGLYEILPAREVKLSEYEGRNLDALRQKMSTMYAVEGSMLFRCMALYYDYGVSGEENGTLLGVR